MQTQDATWQEFRRACSDNNVQQLVLAYLGDPRIPQIDDTAFGYMLQGFSQDLLFRFIPESSLQIGHYRQVVMDLYERLMTVAKEPDMLPEVYKLLSQEGASLNLGALHGIMKLAADRATVRFFEKLAGGIPKADEFLQSAKISALGYFQKAAKIRTWLSENRDLLAKVTKLDLRNLRLYTVPLEIEQFFPNLQTLGLSSNNIFVVPDLDLPKLLDLYLENNQLKSVPDFSRLSSLKELFLAYNHLQSVPDFSRLSGLFALLLHNNHLQSVPDFSSLSSLQVLTLSSNQLQFVPEFIQLRKQGCDIINKSKDEI